MSLVSAAWLAEHGTDPDVVLLDASVTRTEGGYASGRAEFEAAHVPGARFADLVADLSDPAVPFAFARPSAEAFAAAVGALGIAHDTHVVVYDRLNGAWAARVWWLLRSFGHERVSVLDGGLAAWVSAGGPVVVGPTPVVASQDFPAVDHPETVAGIDEVAAISAAGGAGLVCALRADAFAGLESDDPRRGHIPGSANLPYPDFLTADGTIDLERSRAVAASLAGTDVVLYCGGAINAAGAALALHLGGFDRVRLYDGSLSEWKNRADLPLAVGPAVHERNTP